MDAIIDACQDALAAAARFEAAAAAARAEEDNADNATAVALLLIFRSASGSWPTKKGVDDGPVRQTNPGASVLSVR